MSFDVEAAYLRYGPMVIRRCRALLRDPEDAVEAAQDVFVQALVYRERLEERGCASLLYRIATNLCLNRLRSRRRRPEDADSDILSKIAAASVGQSRVEARSILDRLLGRAPPSSGVIAVLHLHDGLTLEEVAAEVGMSVSGVRKRLRRLHLDLAELEEAS